MSWVINFKRPEYIDTLYKLLPFCDLFENEKYIIKYIEFNDSKNNLPVELCYNEVDITITYDQIWYGDLVEDNYIHLSFDFKKGIVYHYHSVDTLNHKRCIDSETKMGTNQMIKLLWQLFTLVYKIKICDCKKYDIVLHGTYTMIVKWLLPEYDKYITRIETTKYYINNSMGNPLKFRFSQDPDINWLPINILLFYTFSTQFPETDENRRFRQILRSTLLRRKKSLNVKMNGHKQFKDIVIVFNKN